MLTPAKNLKLRMRGSDSSRSNMADLEEINLSSGDETDREVRNGNIGAIIVYQIDIRLQEYVMLPSQSPPFNYSFSF